MKTTRPELSTNCRNDRFPEAAKRNAEAIRDPSARYKDVDDHIVLLEFLDRRQRGPSYTNLAPTGLPIFA